MHSTNQSILHSTLHCIFTGIMVGLGSTLVLTGLVFLLMTGAQASETEPTAEIIYADKQQAGQGQLLFEGQGAHAGHWLLAPTVKTEVEIKVSGLIARARVWQIFHNPHQEWMEGIYVFPLPETAAVDQLRMQIGDLTIEGEIEEKQKARKRYQAAKTSGRKASLVEQERPNVFTNSVANIGPGEQIIIEIEYQQAISYDNGQFSLRFPMVVAPRYIPGNTRIKGIDGTGWAVNTNEVTDAARITPPFVPENSGLHNPVSLAVDLFPGLPLSSINSPYHRINEAQLDEKHWRINLAAESVIANRDFVLEWKPQAHQAPQAALFTEDYEGEHYALMMLSPPKLETVTGLAREVIYVIDTSGSMSGTSMPQAKQALQLAMHRLHPGDRFNIIQFNSSTSQLFSAPREVSPQSLAEAQNYISRLQAGGGTEMASALHAALNNQQSSGYVRQVIFLTDGSVGNEQALFEIIRQQLGNSRLFTVGIGSAPNSHFMRSAAEFGRGTHTYIGKLEEIQQKMGRLFEKLEKPALTGVQLHWPDGLRVEVWPKNIPDLYAGEPLLITAKITGHKPAETTLEISGQIAGAPWQASLPVAGGHSHEGVHVTWARHRIAGLMAQERDKMPEQELRQTIVETALHHHLVSQYTSLVAIDKTPARVREEALKSRAMAVHRPAGWKLGQNASQARLPQTATPAQMNLLIGLLCLGLSLITRLLSGRQRS